MTPDGRMAWTLGAALAAWSPAAIAMATGKVELLNGGLIFVAALIAAWIGTGIVSMIMENYQRSNRRVEEAKLQIQRLEQRAEARAERRRAADKRDAEQNA